MIFIFISKSDNKLIEYVVKNDLTTVFTSVEWRLMSFLTQRYAGSLR